MALIRGSQISGSVASASYALTASYALNAGDIFPFSGSAVITGSLVVTGGITGSMNITNLSSGSYTQSFSNQSTWIVQHNLNSAYVVVQTYDSNEEQMLPETIDLTDANTTTISFPLALSGTAVVMVGTPLAGGGGGGNTPLSASYATTASYALSGGSLSISTGSFATTGSNTFRANQIISGSVYVSGGLSVGDSNIRIDTDEAYPFIVGYGSTTPNIKTNTVLGYFVLNSNTTGNSNVGIGFTAMQNNTTGHSNVGIGVGALGSSDAGFKNVGIGYQAAGADVVYNSVAVGYWALRGGGGNSTAVGYEAGKQSTTISYRNVYIGYGAGPTASITESDKLYIANAAGTPLIGGDFSTSEVTINGNLNISGSIIPSVSKSFSLGSPAFPFKDIYISSGSLVIASDDPGAPSTTISNVSGNILISAGGMQLVGSGSFNATTGSFQYISGSMTQVGDYIRIGDTYITGSVSISGSLEASLTEDYVWIGDSNNRSIETPVSSLSTYLTGSLVKSAYGSFYSTQNQSGSANQIQIVTHNVTDFASGVTMVSGSQITFAEAGIYTLISTMQYQETGAGTATITGWLRKNGVDVADSATDLKLKGNGDRDLYAVNYFVSVSAGDYVEFCWSSNDVDTEILYIAPRTSPTRPAVPSVITTVNRVG